MQTVIRDFLAELIYLAHVTYFANGWQFVIRETRNAAEVA